MKHCERFEDETIVKKDKKETWMNILKVVGIIFLVVLALGLMNALIYNFGNNLMYSMKHRK